MNISRIIIIWITFLGWINIGFSQIIFEEVSLVNPDFTTNQSAHGVVIADYDSDGDDDFLILNDSDEESIKLFKNEGDFVFTEVSSEVGLDLKLKSTVGIWVDVDNDGFLDLYIGSESGTSFFKNNADGSFSNLTNESGLATTSTSMSLMAGDLNGDQWIDIYSANLFEESQLFLNHGNLKFYNHIDNSGAKVGERQSMGSVMFDYEQDGDLDIYCVYDIHKPNKFFINDGLGNFRNTAAGLGVDYAGFGMGVDFADFNHDGRYDMYVTYFHRNILLIQQDDGYFINEAETQGVDDASMSWGTLCADINNDTHSDIFIANGINTSGRNILYQNTGEGNFLNVSQDTNLEGEGDSYACAYSDLDGDGKIDLIVANRGAPGIQVFKNSSEEIGNWVQFTLSGTSSNKFGIGTRVEAVVDGVKIFDEVTVGSGYSAQNSSRLHFGVGANDRIDELKVYWPSGNMDSYADIQANLRYLVIENSDISIFTKEDYKSALLKSNTIPLPDLLDPLGDDTILGIVDDMNIGTPKWELYPNPVSGDMINIKSKSMNVSTRFSVLNLSGQAVFNDYVQSDMNNEFDISDLPSGVYILNIGLEKRKIIIE